MVREPKSAGNLCNERVVIFTVSKIDYLINRKCDCISKTPVSNQQNLGLDGIWPVGVVIQSDIGHGKWFNLMNQKIWIYPSWCSNMAGKILTGDHWLCQPDDQHSRVTTSSCRNVELYNVGPLSAITRDDAIVGFMVDISYICSWRTRQLIAEGHHNVGSCLLQPIPTRTQEPSRFKAGTLARWELGSVQHPTENVVYRQESNFSGCKRDVKGKPCIWNHPICRETTDVSIMKSESVSSIPQGALELFIFLGAGEFADMIKPPTTGGLTWYQKPSRLSWGHQTTLLFLTGAQGRFVMVMFDGRFLDVSGMRAFNYYHLLPAFSWYLTFYMFLSSMSGFVVTDDVHLEHHRWHGPMD